MQSPHVRRSRIGWVLPTVLLVILFGVPSLRDGTIVGSQEITELIRSVLMQPWAESVPVLLPIAKFALFLVAITGVLGLGNFPKIVLAYYAVILALVAVFQNVSTLPGGVTILLGNTVAQLIVVVVCVLGLRHTTIPAPLLRGRLWVVPLMLWAWLYPFALSGGAVVAGGWTGVLINAAGVTYCMITPVIAGTMALRPAAYGRTTRATIGWLGTIFGVLNMVTWFAANSESWWMGILHLPLLIIASFLTITSWREPRVPRSS